MASEQNQANHDDHGQNHILPLSVYFGVFSSLMVLTVLTVAVSYWDLGAFSLPVAMLVAVIKAGLVVGFFMHLKYENRFLTLVFVYALFFVGLFFGITMMDITTRGTLNPEEGNFVFKQERNAKKLALIKPAWRPTHAVHGDKKHADKHEQQIAHKSKGVTVIAAGLGHGQAAAPAKRAASGVSAAVLAKGKKKFETLCASCHSKDGSASGVVAKSLKPSPPNFKAGQFRYGGTFESTFKIITDGSPKSPLMTAWKAIIPKAEREAIAHYILSLHKK